MNATGRWLCSLLLVLAAACSSATAADPPAPGPDGLPRDLVGMYIHQHWPYRHPYAARTWTVDDYLGYCGDLRKLGYNAVMVWPVIETMPDPLTDSDRASLDKLARVIDRLHAELGMRVYIALCPNVGVRDDDALRATFEARHFFQCDTRIDPGDPKAVADLLRRREVTLGRLRGADGVVIIDSDPGGYPGSTNAEFVELLASHRRLLDRLRPGIELVYWVHVGWPAYSSWYRTGQFRWNTPAEYVEAMSMLRARDPKPWGIANGLKHAESCGLAGRVISFNYGSIEGEPSMPMTRFDTAGAHAAGANRGPRGVMGNAQTHCVQLPNTFAFARGATGKPAGRADLLAFAEQLVPGQGEVVLSGWEHIESTDTQTARAIAGRLEQQARGELRTGSFPGLLFGDPARFLTDLAAMLRLRSAFTDLAATPPKSPEMTPRLRAFTEALEAWTRRTGYENVWGWPRMTETLRGLGSPEIDRIVGLDTLRGDPHDGATPFDQIAAGLRRGESFTPDLIRALKAEIGRRP